MEKGTKRKHAVVCGCLSGMRCPTANVPLRSRYALRLNTVGTKTHLFGRASKGARAGVGKGCSRKYYPRGAFTFTGLGESASASLGCSHRRDRRSKQLYPTCSELKIFPIASSEDILAVSITRTSSFQGSYSRLTTSSQVGSRRSLISAILVSTRSRCSRRFEQITSISKIGALSDFATSRQASLVR